MKNCNWPFLQLVVAFRERSSDDLMQICDAVDAATGGMRFIVIRRTFYPLWPMLICICLGPMSRGIVATLLCLLEVASMAACDLCFCNYSSDFHQLFDLNARSSR